MPIENTPALLFILLAVLAGVLLLMAAAAAFESWDRRRAAAYARRNMAYNLRQRERRENATVWTYEEMPVSPPSPMLSRIERERGPRAPDDRRESA